MDFARHGCRNTDIGAIAHEAFEYANIDDEAINDQGEAVVKVEFSPDWFEKLRQALKL